MPRLVLRCFVQLPKIPILLSWPEVLWLMLLPGIAVLVDFLYQGPFGSEISQ